MGNNHPSASNATKSDAHTGGMGEALVKLVLPSEDQTLLSLRGGKKRPPIGGLSLENARLECLFAARRTKFLID